MNNKIEKIVELFESKLNENKQKKLKKIQLRKPELFKKAVNMYLLNLSKDADHHYNLFVNYNTFDELLCYLPFIDSENLEIIKENLRVFVTENVINRNPLKRDSAFYNHPPKTRDIKHIQENNARILYNFVTKYPDFINLEDFTEAFNYCECKEYIEKFENEFLKKDNAQTI